MSKKKTKNNSNRTVPYIYEIYDKLDPIDKMLFLNKCFDDLDTEKKRDFFIKKKEKDSLYFQLDACNDKVSIAVEHNNRKLKRCCNICCFLPSSCCYMFSLFMKLLISSVFLLMGLFGGIMIVKIFA